jgi:Spy/CpxP family protein refolding chaperone
MKKILLLLAITAIGYVANAQPPKPPTVEGRMKKVNEQLSKNLDLKEEQKKVVAEAFKDFFTEMEKLRPKNPPPPPVKKEDADKLSKTRDEKIKTVLTPEQYTKYVEVEKSMRPKRPEQKGDKPPTPPEKK